VVGPGKGDVSVAVKHRAVFSPDGLSGACPGKMSALNSSVLRTGGPYSEEKLRDVPCVNQGPVFAGEAPFSGCGFSVISKSASSNPMPRRISTTYAIGVIKAMSSFRRAED
jgi:hypothetical protein